MELCETTRAMARPRQIFLTLTLRPSGGSDFSRSCDCPDCERDFAEYDRAFQDLGEDDQFFADGLLRTHGIVEALKYVRKKIWSPRPPRLDPAQRRICSFFPRLDGRARCWTCGGQHE